MRDSERPTIPAPVITFAPEVPELQLSCILPAPAAELADEADDSADTWLAPAPDDAPAHEEENARAWRPDLVPHITAWLDGIPAASLRHLVRVGVSEAGGLIATFEFNGTEVRFEFDRPTSMIIVCPDAATKTSSGIWWAEKILPFEQRQLEAAALAR